MQAEACIYSYSPAKIFTEGNAQLIVEYIIIKVLTKPSGGAAGAF